MIIYLKDLKIWELLNSNEYGIELQQKMLEILGLQAEYLEIIATDADDDMTINMDGKRVLSILNSRNNKSYGVTRLRDVVRKVV